MSFIVNPYQVAPAGSGYHYLVGGWCIQAGKYTGVAFSGSNNEIATQSLGTGEMMVMSQDHLPSSGKWYWEIQCDQSSPQLQDIIGIGWEPTLAVASTAFGESGHSTIHWVTSPTTSIGTAATTQWNGPARVGVAYNATTGEAWVSINGTYLLSGNPATGANPLFSNIANSPTPTTKPRRIWLRGAADAVISVNKLYTRPSLFSYSVPTGFQALSYAEVDPHWDGVNINNTLLTRSNGNYTLTRTGATGSYAGCIGTHQEVYTTPGRPVYFEVSIDNHVSTSIVVGIAAGTFGTNTYPGAGALDYGYSSAGNKLSNGAATALGTGTYQTGDVIGVAMSGGKLWFSKNGVFNGNPAAGTGEAFTLTAAWYFPAVSLHQSTPNANQITGRFRSGTCIYSPPSGFSYWGSSLTPLT